MVETDDSANPSVGDDDEILIAAEIAAIFRVQIRIVNKWERAGKLPGAFRTPGGYLRMRRRDVEKLTGGIS